MTAAGVLKMDPLAAVNSQIEQLLGQAVNQGILDDQFMQLMQLQVGVCGNNLMHALCYASELVSTA